MVQRIQDCPVAASLPAFGESLLKDQPRTCLVPQLAVDNSHSYPGQDAESSILSSRLKLAALLQHRRGLRVLPPLAGQEAQLVQRPCGVVGVSGGPRSGKALLVEIPRARAIPQYLTPHP